MMKGNEEIKDNAFHHIPVLLDEVIDALSIKKNGIYVDATFGGGGHSREILKKLGDKGRLIAFDHDKDAWQNEINDPRFTLVKENFRYIREFLAYYGATEVDGILADLGVSSHQFDTADRGFSIRYDGPLDMRMDDRLERTAADILNSYSASALQDMFEKNGQVRNAKTLAALIENWRQIAPLRTINEFKKLIESITRGNPNKYLAQVFQALRIEVNEELEALEEFLQKAIDCLADDGRLSVITFHSLEDKMVKHFMKNGGVVSVQVDMFGRSEKKPMIKMIQDVVAGDEELKRNKRSRSARLRVAQRL